MKNKKSVPSTEVKLDSLIAITKDDIVAIKVSDYETKLNNTKTHLGSLIKEITTTLKKQKDELDSDVNTFAASRADDKIKLAIVALKDLYGHKTNVISNCSVNAISYKSKKITFSAEVTLSDAKKHIGKASLEFRFDTKISSSLSAAKKDIDDNKLVLEDLNNQLYEVNKALTNIDVVERQAKAALAKKVIGSTIEGKQFIDSIESIPGVSGVKLIGSK